jgi:hypothetical protein
MSCVIWLPCILFLLDVFSESLTALQGGDLFSFIGMANSTNSTPCYRERFKAIIGDLCVYPFCGT